MQSGRGSCSRCSVSGRRPGIVFFVLLLAPILLTAPASASGTTIVHAGWLLARPGEPPVAQHSIVVADGLVMRVVPGFIDEPGTTIVDLTRQFVLPGLIDCHVHLAFAPGRGESAGASVQTEADYALLAARHAGIALQAGFTTVVDLGTVGAPGHENAIFAVRDAVHAGTLDGPRIISAGTPIAATGLARSATLRDEIEAVSDMRSVCNGADDCRRAVRHQVRRGSDIIVFFNTGSLLSEDQVEQALSDEEMRAIVETAHALGRKVIADGHHAAGIAAALRAGADIIDSAHLYDDQTFQLFGDHQYLQSHIYGVVNAVGETRETLRDGLWGWLPEPILLRFLRIRSRPFAMMQAYRAGMRRLSYASDAGVYPWGDNAADLVEFVRRGMSADDAIRTATVNAAHMLGMQDVIGSIEPGKSADMIATAGNPFDDISTVMDVRFVMRNGIVFRRNGIAVRTPAEGSAP